jgi:hypothetical protein
MITFMSDHRASFGEFSLHGGRFIDGEGMPIEALEELKNYRTLIVSVASSLYRNDHPQKNRLPRGFEKQLDMRVRSFRKGCLAVDLDYNVNEATQYTFDDENINYFIRARESVEREAKTILETGAPSDDGSFPEETLPQLLKTGKTLHDDEKLLIGDGQDSQAWFDKTWREIVKELEEPQPEDAVIVGRIIGLSVNMNDGSATYKFLESESGSVFTNKASNTMWPKLRNFLGQASGPLVNLSVDLMKPVSGPETIVKTKNVELALPESYQMIIQDLTQLKKGWYDPPEIFGEPISPVSIDRTELIIQASVEDGHGDMTITPVPDGGVQIEWTDNDYEIVVAPEGWVHAFNLSDDRDEDGEMKFPQTAPVGSIIDWLENGKGETA